MEQTDLAAAAATVSDGLPLDDLTLIGIYLRPDGPSALLRLPSGEIRRVETGDRVDRATIAVIAENGIALVEGGTETVLLLPTG